MLGFLLRVLFLTVVAQFVARVFGALLGRSPRRDSVAPRPRPQSLGGEIVDAEFEDLGKGSR